MRDSAARPIGLAALTVLELTPPDMVTCAAEAGYDTIGFRIIPGTPEEVQHPIIGDTPMRRETARRAKDSGVRVLDVEIFRLKPETDVADYEAALETGAVLGATEALAAGHIPDEARLAERFGDFCDLAARFGIAANLEPMPWTEVKNFAQGARIVAVAARPNGGVLIDPIHFDRGGSRPEEIASVPRARLRYAQLCDAPAERPHDLETLLLQARAERLMPGDGGLDLTGILRALPHDIPISLEVPMKTLAQTVPALERSRRILAKTRALLQRLD
jgi:sugar phosphate isomerase/epimerase